MHHQPQQHEVGVDFAREHRFEIEIEKRLPRQRLVVAQHAQAQAVRYDRPQVRAAAVEKLLHQAVRVCGCRAVLSGSSAIKRQSAAEQMDREGTGETPDGKGAAVQLGPGGHRQEAESQLA